MTVTHRLLLFVVGAIGLAALIGVGLLWPGPRVVPPPNPLQTTQLENATLLEVAELGVDETGITPGAVTIRVVARLETSGETVTFETTDDTGALYRPGQRVRLATITQEGLPPAYFISDFRRSTPMILLVGLFVTAVLALGRWQGARALLGLALTFLLIVGFIIPAILDGRSPLTVAVVGSLLIMIVTLYLSHGFTPKTTAAVVATSVSLLVTGLLAVLFVGATNLTGFSSEEARLANLEVGGLSLRGLLLAGIIIGGLGVLDDVTMSQSSTVFELHRANPSATLKQLVRGALTVGRDHIAATVNTLFLAYAGASLPLLILFAGSPDPFGTVVTSETVAVEVVRTLVGSVGLVAAVPLTTTLAGLLVLAGSSSGANMEGFGRKRGGDAQSKLQNIRLDENSTTVTSAPDEEAEEEWEQRLRDAYRLRPPGDNT